MKIGFALTTYDKWDDLAIAIKVLRAIDKKYYISVCSNHPYGKQYVKEMDMDIDQYAQARDIPFKSSGFAERKSPFLNQEDASANYARRLRGADSVRHSCACMQESGCDYVIHTHADGWFLSGEKIQNLVNYMDENEIAIGCRGKGIEYAWHPFRNCNSFGQVDDHAFIFDVAIANQYRLWNYDPVSLLYHKNSVHSMLALVFATKIGLHNMWFYRDTRHLLDIFGKQSSSLNPLSYDPAYDYIHINKGSLDYKWGLALQARYLRAYSFNFLEQYYDPDILKKIYKRNKELNRKLFLYAFPKNVRKNLSTEMKARYLKNANALTIPKNLYHRATKRVLDSMFKIPNNAPKKYKKSYGIDDFESPNWTDTIYRGRL